MHLWFWGWLVTAAALALAGAFGHGRGSLPFAAGAAAAAAADALGLVPASQWAVLLFVSGALFVALNRRRYRPRHAGEREVRRSRDSAASREP